MLRVYVFTAMFTGLTDGTSLELLAPGMKSHAIDPESSRMNRTFAAGYAVPDCSGTSGIVTATLGSAINVVQKAKTSALRREEFVRGLTVWATMAMTPFRALRNWSGASPTSDLRPRSTR